jgi:hypothetical protein
MSNYVLIKKFCELTGYTDKAVRHKVALGVWLEGKEYVRAPDGHIVINMDNYYKWVESKPCQEREPAASRSAQIQ